MGKETIHRNIAAADGLGQQRAVDWEGKTRPPAEGGRGTHNHRFLNYSAAPPLVAPCLTPPLSLAPSLIANSVLLFEMNRVSFATTGVL